MTQNLIDLVFSDEQLRAIDGAIATLEANLAGLVALTATQRHKLHKMGNATEPFCRRALSVLAQNPQIVPPSIPVAGAHADLETLDQLRPRAIRLKRLMERVDDSEMALGSDLLAVALAGYKLIKVAGTRQGLDNALQDLEPRFQRARRANRDQAEAG